MHDAIAMNKSKSDIVKDLLASPLANFTQISGKGFNVLQWAAMNDFKLWVLEANVLFTEWILWKQSQTLYNLVKDEWRCYDNFYRLKISF